MRLVLVSILSLMVFSSCDKDNPGPEEPSYGKFNALQNGEKWGERYPGHHETVIGRKGTYGTAIPCNEYYLITAAIYNKEAFLREVLTFIKVPLIEGKHKIIRFEFECEDNAPEIYSNLYTISNDGDVLQDHYNVLETADNFINIDSYNSKTQEIKGTFQVTYIIERRSVNDPSSLPDTLRFTNGTFHTKILMD